MHLRIIAPIVIVLMAVLAAVGFVVSNNTAASVKQSIETQMVQSLDTVKAKIEAVEQSVKQEQTAQTAAQASTDAKNLSLAQSMARSIAENPSILETENLRSEVRSLGADEIYVTDENGIIRWTNVPPSLGTSLEKNSSMDMFAAILSNSSLEFVQAPKLQASGRLYQQVAVSRAAEKGVIVLSFSIAPSVATTDAASEYQKIVQSELAGVSGGVIILDSAYTYIADSASLSLGTSAADEPWISLLTNNQDASFEFEHGSTPVYAKSVKCNETTIVAYVPLSELEGYRLTPMVTVILIGGVGIVLLVYIVYLLVNRVVLKPLDHIAGQAVELQRGERINVEELRKNSEAAIIGHAVNEMLDRVELDALGSEDAAQPDEDSGKQYAGGSFGEAVGGNEGFVDAEEPFAEYDEGAQDQLASEFSGGLSAEELSYQSKHARQAYGYLGSDQELDFEAYPAADAAAEAEAAAGVEAPADYSREYLESTKPEYEPEPEPQPESVVEPAFALEPVAAPASEPAPWPEPELEFKPVPEPEPAVEFEPVPEPAVEPAPALALASETKPEPVPAAEPEPDPEPAGSNYRLDQALRNAVSLIRPHLQKKAIRFSVLLDKEVSIEVCGNERSFTRATMKALASAVVATPENGHLECVVSTQETGRGLVTIILALHISNQQKDEIKSDTHNLKA